MSTISKSDTVTCVESAFRCLFEKLSREEEELVTEVRRRRSHGKEEEEDSKALVLVSLHIGQLFLLFSLCCL